MPLLDIVTRLTPLSLTVSCPACKELPAPVIFKVPWDPTWDPNETVLVAMALPPAVRFSVPVP
ncbi:hypothetical protein D3C85_1895340 [compost metagenome]